ncbi:hypothetical protein LMG27952_06151 [Paraburkholderia hiiakae]|uniref:Short chain dehydrogenase n=1 Tax=Paraburkholderia hiiakae TaxID=1081782 RepID=A0ABM8P566_9BURK|nr:hypothetical protein LMG27952_06151 [Paraburkholderia hiiakae]
MSLYENVNATGRRIDIVFANAGIAEFAALGNITEAHFDKLFSTNVKGVLFTVQKALPLLNDGASIILTGSVASVKWTPTFWVYGATKAAVRNFVRGWTFNGEQIYQVFSYVYPLLTSRDFQGGRASFETFPDAVTCALRGEEGTSAKEKRWQRPEERCGT